MLLNLGVRGHDFGKLPLPDLASRIASAGLRCVQLAPPKAVAGLETDVGTLSPGFAVMCREALAREGVAIAVLGCYINLSEPEASRREPQLERFKTYLRLARDFGCSIVGTESGSLASDFSWHPDNHGEHAYRGVLESVAELVAEAESFGVCVGIEGVAHFTIHSPQRLRRLLDDIGSSHLQIILDPVNLLGATIHRDQERIVKEAFDLLGDRIAVAHLKDFVMEEGRFRSVAAGTPGGMLDTELFLRLLAERKPGVQIVLEDTHPDTIASSVETVRTLAATLG
ncbi:sugar phosphate isomerase/epimerase [Opitutales bacterium ASA1]|uniref:sugar phosphate isomerase/epimerase family protein n=1 Tax=Congregicoccus parvus TaxID=3081749 RepID=UPI002B2CE705|nr:sugar phosphate isomerase/epimerase [Opitutales bacterium ASA1]